jgi:hypothetical protein
MKRGGLPECGLGGIRVPHHKYLMGNRAQSEGIGRSGGQLPVMLIISCPGQLTPTPWERAPSTH